MKILALDLGTTTGWAVSVDGLVSSGSQSFKPTRFEGAGMRFLKFKRFLSDLKGNADGFDMVVFEEVRRHRGVDAAHAYGGFMAHLTAWCEHHQIPYRAEGVGVIKKFWTGKGNASKEEMIDAALAKGYTPADDNEADAIALLHLAMEYHR
jgi:Holliday junction resolvasome RuvABC endonuclease subunit